MIPDEAVEAAAKALYNKAFHLGLSLTEAEAAAEVALEAAAPFIAAQAWDEGMNDAWDNSETMQVSLQALYAMNPYREAKDTGNE